MADKIKLGILGLGRAGKGMHLAELAFFADQIQVYAVCDLIESRRNEVAKEYNAKAYADYEDMLKDPEVEVISVATLSCDHYKHAMMALEAGKKVFLEKPICTNYEDACKLIEFAKTFDDERLFIRHNRRFEKHFMKAEEIIASGVLGDVYMVKLTRNGWQFRNDWQTLDQYGGGQLLNWGPHVVDQALRFCGGTYTELLAADRRLVNASGDCEDVIKATFKGENGRIVDIELCMATPINQPLYTIYGTRGTFVDNGSDIFVKYMKPGLEKERREPNTNSEEMTGFGYSGNVEWVEESINLEDNSLRETYQYVYEAVKEGKPYPVTLDQALEVMRAIDDIKKNGKLIKY